MMTILVCWYSLGWATIALICYMKQIDELTIAGLIGMIIMWPALVLLLAGLFIISELSNYIIWKTP